ncbi:cell division protein ZapE [Povalibacter uvarum]|uniref:Cell division protein ZapE n=1 Tax=Povalibacter uvarum TaxID=732238 RepID=A0A841HR90_9GAMM|nr:cell division protein ZapE [Povalibacter uvarum]MBB6094415.1 cell division protein ZapE [Povalibacter uvarum]
MDNVSAHYQRECARLGYQRDAAQERIVALLDELRLRLIKPRSAGLLKGLFNGKQRELEKGLYIWGGVGRGKTWMMDLFFHSLPFKDKQRSHFHRFMQSVHDELKKHKDQADPLELVAEKIAKKTRVLCFDELFVADIGDAMLLANLFRGLFDRGVTLVATSNVPPDDLYKDGLQRARFIPAIKLLKEHTQVVQIDKGVDFRLRALESAPTAFAAGDAGTPGSMTQLFEQVAGEAGTPNATLTLNHRRLHPKRLAEDVVWFDFKELCDGPRGQADYIEIARCFHTVMLSDIPVLTTESENQARRFVTLVDEFYDRGVKLIVSTVAPVTQIYRGSKLAFEFERTSSRLIEMQSQEYLSRPHRP